MPGCSRSTLQRRMHEWGLHRREPTLDDAALESLIVELKGSLGLFYGERAMMGLLASRKVWAPRWKVRKILQRVDPEGIQERYACFDHLGLNASLCLLLVHRWKRAIVRRQYSVPFPNSLWHIDGHHKVSGTIFWNLQLFFLL